VALIDNYNTDAEMRPFLTPINSLPTNAEGKPFGDGVGLFSVRYRVKDLSGNESDVVERIINVLPEGGVGLGDVINMDGFMSVYPNPSNGIFNLRLLSAQAENIQVSVFDMLGKLVQQQEINGRNLQANELDLSVQPKGFYVLKVQTGDKMYTKRIQIN